MVRAMAPGLSLSPGHVVILCAIFLHLLLLICHATPINGTAMARDERDAPYQAPTDNKFCAYSTILLPDYIANYGPNYGIEEAIYQTQTHVFEPASERSFESVSFGNVKGYGLYLADVRFDTGPEALHLTCVRTKADTGEKYLDHDCVKWWMYRKANSSKVDHFCMNAAFTKMAILSADQRTRYNEMTYDVNVAYNQKKNMMVLSTYKCESLSDPECRAWVILGHGHGHALGARDSTKGLMTGDSLESYTLSPQSVFEILLARIDKKSFTPKLNLSAADLVPKSDDADSSFWKWVIVAVLICLFLLVVLPVLVFILYRNISTLSDWFSDSSRRFSNFVASILHRRPTSTEEPTAAGETNDRTPGAKTLPPTIAEQLAQTVTQSAPPRPSAGALPDRSATDDEDRADDNDPIEAIESVYDTIHSPTDSAQLQATFGRYRTMISLHKGETRAGQGSTLETMFFPMNPSQVIHYQRNSTI